MNPAQIAIKFVDRFQQRLPGLSFVVAVYKKFSDDQAGNLAALIAYYAFVSLFPLLLVLFTLLSIVLRDNQHLREKVISAALTDYPGFASLLQDSIRSFSQTGPALVFGVIVTVLGTKGVATAIQNALNSVWEVPRENRPGFPWSWLRSFGLILVVGIGEISTSIASGFVSTATILPSFALKAVAAAMTLLFNIGVFWLAFRLATASWVSWRDLRLGAILSGIVWEILQLLGTYFVTHELVHSKSLYGPIVGAVLGLIAWLYLLAEATLYAAEANVVWVRRLWPRSLAPPPLTKGDIKAYEMYAQVEDRSKNETIDVHVTPGPSPGPQPSPSPQPSSSSQPSPSPGDTIRPGNAGEKIPERAETTPAGGDPAGSGPPPVSAGTARGEDPHDSGDDR